MDAHRGLGPEHRLDVLGRAVGRGVVDDQDL
jgi:hypothetical protein